MKIDEKELQKAIDCIDSLENVYHDLYAKIDKETEFRKKEIAEIRQRVDVLPDSLVGLMAELLKYLNKKEDV